MTWSIIAKDSTTGEIGIAVATRFFAVGALVPHIAPGIGGIATQALVNPYYGIDGARLLREGKSPDDIVESCAARVEPDSLRAVFTNQLFGLPDTKRITTPMLVLGAMDDGMISNGQVRATARAFRRYRRDAMG